MLVSKLNIKEFRGIKSCKTPIELSNFTVLIGRNNSGKSTILEALSLLPSPNIVNSISGHKRIDYLEKLHQSRKRLLYLYAGTSNLEYYIENKVIQFEINENNIDYLINKQSLPSNNYDIAFSQMLKHNYQELQQSVLYIPCISSILDDLENKIRSLKELVMKKGYHIEIANILNEFVNDKYSEIVFLEPISLRKVYQNNIEYLQLKDLGSGAEKVVKIMILLELLEPRLVLIDDFEAGLHPSLIKIFIKWLKDKKWQIVISTHSIDLLYHLAEIKPEDATILQLNKSNEDILNYNVLNLEELEDILNANTDPRLLGDALSL